MKRLFLALAVVAGCGGAPPTKVMTAVIDPAPANVERFHREEADLLRALSTFDPRLALRIGTHPSDAELRKAAMSALIAGDSSLVVHEGALDVFSFESRARGLEAAAKSAEGWTYPLAGEAKLERDLVKRLIVEEKARLSEERRLPASASELVRALVVTWAPAATPEALKAKDDWLTRRMDDVRESLTNDVLTTVELNELDDALDPLERLTVGYSGTAASLARLRIALAQVHPASIPLGTWAEVQSAGLSHLGVKIDLTTLRAELERVRSGLHELIALENKGVSRVDQSAGKERAERLVLIEGTCRNAQGIRSLGPSPERAPICGLLGALATPDLNGNDVLRRVLHDDLTVALWALAIHGDKLEPRRAAEKYRIESGIPPEREVRLLRRAVVRPVSVLGVGLAVTMLDTVSAERWLAFGDAPLDVIATELTFARAPLASPRP